MNENGRAETSRDKAEITRRLCQAWCKTSHQRFGQFLLNVAATDPELFYLEDVALADRADAYVARNRGR